jgi:hypothetical protein
MLYYALRIARYGVRAWYSLALHPSRLRDSYSIKIAKRANKLDLRIKE